MPTPPAKIEISDTYPNPSSATARLGFGRLWETLFGTGGLLGSTGNASDARAALGFGVIAQRNRIINGNFAINQRVVSGTVVLAAGVYGHDRWKAGASGCTYTFSTTGLDTTITISAGSLQQVIESVNVEGGNYVMTWTGTAQGRIAGGSYAATGVAATGVTAAATLTVEFNTGTLTRVQVEPGASGGASPFDRRLMAAELALCQRYYETGVGRFAGYGSGVCQYEIGFKATKRATPTLVYASISATNVSTFDARNPTVNSLTWYCVVTVTAGFVWDGTWTASAEL